MAWTLIAHTKSATATTGAINTTGADLLIVVGNVNAIGATVSDSLSNAGWALAVQSPSNSFNTYSDIWYCKAPTVGSSQTFTVTGTQPGVEVLAFSGSDQTSPLDQTNGAGQNGGNTIQPGSVTPGTAGQLVISSAVLLGTTQTLSINLAFTISDQQVNVNSVTTGGGAAYLIQTAATAVNPTWTESASATDMFNAAIATFKAAAGAVSSPQALVVAPPFRVIPGIGAGGNPTKPGTTGLFLPTLTLGDTTLPVDFSAVGVTATVTFAAPAGAASIDNGQTPIALVLAPAFQTFTGPAFQPLVTPSGMTAAAGGDVSITGPTAVVVFTANPGTVSVTLPGATSQVAIAAPTGTVSVTLPGATAQVVVAAPAGTVSVTLPGQTAAVVYAAPPGTVSVTLPGTTAAVVFAAPAGSVSVTLPGVTAATVFTAPAGGFATGSGAAGVTAAAVFTAPPGTVSVTLPGVTAATVFAAPAGTASVAIPGVTAAITFAAPAGTVSTTLPGVTAAVTFAAPAGGFQLGGGVAGVTAGLVLTAVPGTVSVTVLGVTAQLVLAAPAGGFSAASNFSAAGVTAAVTFAAPAGKASVGINGPTALLTVTANAGVIAVTLPGATARLVFAAPPGGLGGQPFNLTASTAPLATLAAADRVLATLIAGDKRTGGPN